MEPADAALKILLIDDSRTMRQIQRNVLSKIGYLEVSEAEDGLDAIAKLDEVNPDLIIVDYNMPNMDGLSFVKAFRASGRTAPIIMVTTEAERNRVVEAIKAGVNAYVVKPFTPEILQQRINEAQEKAA